MKLTRMLALMALLLSALAFALPANAATTCTVTSAMGACGPYYDPTLFGPNGAEYVNNDVWNPVTGWHQKLTVTSDTNWRAVASMPKGNTSVISYPDTQQLMSAPDYGPLPFSGIPDLTSSFKNVDPGPAGTANAYDFGYDIFTGIAGDAASEWNYETMIWTASANEPPGTRSGCGGDTVIARDVWFGGSNGVPKHRWNLCVNGSPTDQTAEKIWYPAVVGNMDSGSVDVQAMMNWMVSNGYLPANSGYDAIDYGVEICSTGGKAATFGVSHWTLTSP